MSEFAIKLPESLTIHHIESLHGTLKLDFSSDQDEITIDASDLENIDTSGLQLLSILIKDACANGKKISWENTNDVLTSSASKIGLSSLLLLD